MLLAIDTSTAHASIALYDRALLAELTWIAGSDHSRQLLPRVRDLFSIVGRPLGALSSVAVALGPGSFNGLRVGLATAKALSFALSLPTVGVETLLISAYPFRLSQRAIRPLYDAGRSDVATGLYRERFGGFVTLEAPRIVTLDEALAESPTDTFFCGEIRPEWRQQIEERIGAGAAGEARLPNAAEAPRRAGYLAELASVRLAAGLVDDPATLQPLYLRRPSVTTAARAITGAAQ